MYIKICGGFPAYFLKGTTMNLEQRDLEELRDSVLLIKGKTTHLLKDLRKKCETVPDKEIESIIEKIKVINDDVDSLGEKITEIYND